MAILSVDGSKLVYSTYLGGSDDDIATGIAIDQHGVAVVTGETRSIDFPLQSPLQSQFGGGVADAFVTALDPNESVPMFSTYLGGSGDDIGAAIAVDVAGSVYLTGETTSPNFKTVQPWQARLAGGVRDAFVVKLEQGGTAFVYSTYLGGRGFDRGSAIVADRFGHAYVTGMTDSTDFPTTDDVVQSFSAGEGDAFVTKLSRGGSTLLFSTYLGGSRLDEGRGIAVDSRRNVHVIGRTASPDFLEVEPLQDGFDGGQDVFLAKIGPRGSTLGYSTYLGGVRDDIGNGIAVDASGSVYVAGVIRSSGFPTVGTFRNLLGRASSGAAFIVKIDSEKGAGLNLPDLFISMDRVKFTTRARGDRVVVVFTIQNIGTVDAQGPILISLSVSEASRAGDGDVLIHSAELGGLKSGHKIKEKFKVTGLNLIDGNFIILQIDAADAVVESDELNNIVVQKLVFMK